MIFALPFSLFLAKPWPGPSRADRGQFCTMRSGPSLKELNWIECRKSDPAYMIRPNCGCMLTITKMFPNGIWHVYWILKRWWCRATALDVEHQVKHNWTWSPHGWVTVTCSALCPSWEIPPPPPPVQNSCRLYKSPSVIILVPMLAKPRQV